MTYTEEEKRAAAREALDWCAQSHGTLSALARERGRDLESLKSVSFNLEVPRRGPGQKVGHLAQGA